MKANELMIGDWVIYHNSGCIDAMNDTAPYDENIQIQHNDFAGDELFFGLLSPIPLTPEILRKNGFMHFHPENKKAEYWQIYIKDGDINVKITYGHFRFFITGKPIQKEAYRPTFNGHLIYVHELQHALRLCGIEKEIVL